MMLMTLPALLVYTLGTPKNLLSRGIYIPILYSDKIKGRSVFKGIVINYNFLLWYENEL